MDMARYLRIECLDLSISKGDFARGIGWVNLGALVSFAKVFKTGRKRVFSTCDCPVLGAAKERPFSFLTQGERKD